MNGSRESEASVEAKIKLACAGPFSEIVFIVFVFCDEYAQFF